MWISQAECFCDSCGSAICFSRKKEIMAADDLNESEFDAIYGDQTKYDSDYYPKQVSVGESDSPDHCGSGENCLEAEVLPSGRKIGKLLHTQLTKDGVEYVKQHIIISSISDKNEVTDFWEEQFKNYL